MEEANGIIKNIEPMLRELAEKLGTTSEYLWTVLIKQAYISGFGSCYTIVGILGAFAGYFYLGKLVHKKVADDSWDSEALIPLYIVGGIGFVAGAIIVICLPYEIITAFMNPEYWALNKILSKVE